jgi:hypothetical protein
MSQSRKKNCSICGKYRLFYKLEDEHCRSCHARLLQPDSEVELSTQKRCNNCKEVFKLSEFSTPRGTYNSYCRKCSNFLVAEWKRSKRPMKQLDKIFNELRNCILDLEDRDEAEQHINNLEKKLKQLIIQ